MSSQVSFEKYKQIIYHLPRASDGFLQNAFWTVNPLDGCFVVPDSSSSALRVT